MSENIAPRMASEANLVHDELKKKYEHSTSAPTSINLQLPDKKASFPATDAAAEYTPVIIMRLMVTINGRCR
jgi:hypothetical protein